MSDDLLIHELGPQGDGVHRSARGPVYVDRALPGDLVRVRIRTGAGGVLRGELIDVVAPSPHRAPAPCPNYDACGGCTLQHAHADFYRDWKVEVVRAALRRQNLEPEFWNAPVFLPEGKRRRVTFAAFKKGKSVTLGYFRRRSHQVTEIAACLVVDPAIMALRDRLATSLGSILQDGKAADIFIQTANGRFDVVITGAVGRKGTPDLQVHEALAELAHGSKIDRVSWRAREREEPEVMLEVNPVRARFGALDVALPPLAFLQPTTAGEEALVAAVMDALPNAGKFADLFAGCGTFTGSMLTRGSVDAYETVATAVRALNKARGPKPLTATQRDLFRDPLSAEEAGGYDAIVFDPPRAGAQEQAKALAASRVPILIGVSCNPATFARDARILVDGGHRLRNVTMVDQFTWSHHVELVAAFTR